MTQQLLSHHGAFENRAAVLAGLGTGRVLLVTGGKSFETSGAAGHLEKQLSRDLIAAHFCDFSANPKLEDALRGVKIAEQHQIDCILAVGGGSVMDMAKLIKLLQGNAQEAAAIITGKRPVVPQNIPLIAVPTTAGSGSEATHFAVVYKDGIKYSVANDALLPDMAIIDGSLLQSATAYQRACSGMDALAQAIESYWSVHANVESQAFAKRAILALYRDLPAWVAGENSLAQAIGEAAHFAGRAINVTKTTAPHAFSYGFTSRFGLPHGHAIWMTLPQIFQIHCQTRDTHCQGPRGSKYLENVMAELMQMLGILEPSYARHLLTEFAQGLGLDLDLQSIAAEDQETLRTLATSVNRERLANNPVRLDEAALAKIFGFASQI